MERLLYMVITLIVFVLYSCTGSNPPSNSQNLPSVTICNQVWTLKNLDVSTYRNGDPIPKVTDNTTWSNLTTGAYCYYNNDSATYAATYGKLYNWYAINDPRGLAPVGWHIPTDEEWNKLVKCIDPAADTSGVPLQSRLAGGKLKETGLVNWDAPNVATNSTGFTALPGGYRDKSGGFGAIRLAAVFWTSTQYSSDIAWDRDIITSDANLARRGYGYKKNGQSIRCIKN